MKKIILSAKRKTQCFMAKTAYILSNNKGEGTVSQAILILISVVLGGLLLAGLYALFNEIVLPTLSQRIQQMFDYQG